MAREMLEGSCLSDVLNRLEGARSVAATNPETGLDDCASHDGDSNDYSDSYHSNHEDSSTQNTGNTSQAARSCYNEVFGDLRDQGLAVEGSVLIEVRLASRAGRSHIAYKICQSRLTFC